MKKLLMVLVLMASAGCSEKDPIENCVQAGLNGTPGYNELDSVRKERFKAEVYGWCMRQKNGG